MTTPVRNNPRPANASQPSAPAATRQPAEETPRSLTIAATGSQYSGSPSGGPRHVDLATSGDVPAPYNPSSASGATGDASTLEHRQLEIERDLRRWNRYKNQLDEAGIDSSNPVYQELTTKIRSLENELDDIQFQLDEIALDEANAADEAAAADGTDPISGEEEDPAAEEYPDVVQQWAELSGKDPSEVVDIIRENFGDNIDINDPTKFPPNPPDERLMAVIEQLDPQIQADLERIQKDFGDQAERIGRYQDEIGQENDRLNGAADANTTYVRMVDRTGLEKMAEIRYREDDLSQDIIRKKQDIRDRVIDYLDAAYPNANVSAGQVSWEIKNVDPDWINSDKISFNGTTMDVIDTSDRGDVHLRFEESSHENVSDSNQYDGFGGDSEAGSWVEGNTRTGARLRTGEFSIEDDDQHVEVEALIVNHEGFGSEDLHDWMMDHDLPTREVETD